MGLHFHIDQYGQLTPHAGHKSVTREATDPELQMWHAMIPEAPHWRPGDGVPPDVPVWDAVPKELEDALWKGVYTLHPDDAEVLRRVEGFTPIEGMGALVGEYREAKIRVSSFLPKGYFVEGLVAPEMTPWAKTQVEMRLRGLGVR
jgi:hypothetical protein